MSSENLYSISRKICFFLYFIYKQLFYGWYIMKKAIVSSIILTLLLIWVDKLTKYIFYNLQLWNKTSIFYPLLNDWISWWISMPMAIILIISIISIWLFVYLFYKKYLTIVEFALLFAWTIWNLIDRICLWWVRDFIAIGRFPVFNIADAFLTCGVAWICVKEIFHLQKKHKNLP